MANGNLLCTQIINIFHRLYIWVLFSSFVSLQSNIQFKLFGARNIEKHLWLFFSLMCQSVSADFFSVWSQLNNLCVLFDFFFQINRTNRQSKFKLEFQLLLYVYQMMCILFNVHGCAWQILRLMPFHSTHWMNILRLTTIGLPTAPVMHFNSLFSFLSERFVCFDLWLNWKSANLQIPKEE